MGREGGEEGSWKFPTGRTEKSFPETKTSKTPSPPSNFLSREDPRLGGVCLLYLLSFSFPVTSPPNHVPVKGLDLEQNYLNEKWEEVKC